MYDLLPLRGGLTVQGGERGLELAFDIPVDFGRRFTKVLCEVMIGGHKICTEWRLVKQDQILPKCHSQHATNGPRDFMFCARPRGVGGMAPESLRPAPSRLWAPVRRPGGQERG